MPPLAGVKLVLGGESRVLRYTNRALVALEVESGLTMAELAGQLAKGSIRVVAQLCWAGLLHAEPKLTVGAVVDMIDLRELDPLTRAIMEAMDQAFGPPQAETEEPGKAPAVVA